MLYEVRSTCVFSKAGVLGLLLYTTLLSDHRHLHGALSDHLHLLGVISDYLHLHGDLYGESLYRECVGELWLFDAITDCQKSGRRSSRLEL